MRNILNSQNLLICCILLSSCTNINESNFTYDNNYKINNFTHQQRDVKDNLKFIIESRLAIMNKDNIKAKIIKPTIKIYKSGNHKFTINSNEAIITDNNIQSFENILTIVDKENNLAVSSDYLNWDTENMDIKMSGNINIRNNIYNINAASANYYNYDNTIEIKEIMNNQVLLQNEGLINISSDNIQINVNTGRVLFTSYPNQVKTNVKLITN